MVKKGDIIQKLTGWKIVLGIQLIASLLFVTLLFKLGALPLKYIIAVVVIIILLFSGIFCLIKPSKSKSKAGGRNLVSKVLSLLLSIILLIGSLYIAQGNSTINAITNANTQTTRISVVVLKNSQYEKLSDLKNSTIEVNSSVEQDKMKSAIEALKKEESSLKIKEAVDFNEMADDLYNGKIPAIYVNEAHYAMLESNHENFETETRVIYTFEYEEKLNDISKDVSVTKDPFIVYISGIDTYGKVSTVSRSDVNMLVTVNPKTKQILMTSIPRDYYVTLANRGEKDKLTHSGLAGIENTVKTMENFMGIEINYYARVNFTSLIKMVDALGGIELYIPKTFVANDGAHTQFVKGNMKLDGEKALAYSRERYAFGGGDNARVQHQQEVLEAMLKKMMSPAIITNYSSVLKSIDGSFETNMKSSDITGLIQMQINDMASWNIIQKQLTGTGQMMTGGSYMPNNSLYYMIPDQNSFDENKQAIEKVLKGESVE